MQLLGFLRNISVNINGKHLVFDENGNPNIGYKLIEWIWNGSNVHFKTVGHFYEQLSIKKSLLTWHTGNSEVISEVCKKIHLNVLLQQS